MPSDIRLRDFQRWFQRLGVRIEMLQGKGSHFMMMHQIGDTEYAYPVPTIRGRYVKHLYLDKARKALKLTAADGVTDEVFFKK